MALLMDSVQLTDDTCYSSQELMTQSAWTAIIIIAAQSFRILNPWEQKYWTPPIQGDGFRAGNRSCIIMANLRLWEPRRLVSL